MAHFCSVCGHICAESRLVEETSRGLPVASVLTAVWTHSKEDPNRPGRLRIPAALGNLPAKDSKPNSWLKENQHTSASSLFVYREPRILHADSRDGVCRSSDLPLNCSISVSHSKLLYVIVHHGVLCYIIVYYGIYSGI